MARTPKYLGKYYGVWQVVYYGVDYVQPTLTKKRGADGKLLRSKRPGTRLYYYILERETSDNKATKLVRLTSAQMLKVDRGECSVDDFVEKKRSKSRPTYVDKVSYYYHR